MMNFDLIVIGSGPGGYVAAIRAAQLRMNVAVIEKSDLGGICLNWGCIPTKALLKSAQIYNFLKHSEDYGVTCSDFNADFEKIIARSRNVAATMNKGIEFLFKKNNVNIINGIAKLKDKNSVAVTKDDGSEEIVTASKIILATGARSKDIPAFKQDHKFIIGYKDALSLQTLPESMVVIGSGAIGTELAFFYKSLGTDVTLIEFLPEIVPLEDEEISKQLARSFKKIGMKIMTGTAVNKVEIIDDKCVVNYSDKKGENKITCDIVLSAVGITTNLENLGLEALNIRVEGGKVVVDDCYQTNVAGIYAIGDIVKGPALAHVASAEAICCVENIAGLNPEKVDYNNIPSCVYTTPEIASVGLTEKEVKEQNIDYKVGKFSFMASGKATAAGNKDGFVKLLFDTHSDELLGAHIIGDNIAEMISEMVVLKKLGGHAKDLIKAIHPHPSLSEAIMEAAANAHGEAVHC